MADTTQQVWDAYIVYEGEEDQHAGQLAYEAGMLSVVEAQSDEDREFLEGVAEDMNALEFLVDLAPPQDSDAPRYSVGAIEYDRQHPEFEQVMIRKLRENHSLRVEPASK